MPTIDDLSRLRAKMESLQREASRATGALDQVMRQLKNEFECATLADAEAMLARLERDTTVAEQKFEKAYHDFCHDHPELAEGH